MIFIDITRLYIVELYCLESKHQPFSFKLISPGWHVFQWEASSTLRGATYLPITIWNMASWYLGSGASRPYVAWLIQHPRPYVARLRQRPIASQSFATYIGSFQHLIVKFWYSYTFENQTLLVDYAFFYIGSIWFCNIHGESDHSLLLFIQFQSTRPLTRYILYR